jgi:hypothetical protein
MQDVHVCAGRLPINGWFDWGPAHHVKIPPDDWRAYATPFYWQDIVYTCLDVPARHSPASETVIRLESTDAPLSHISRG